MIRRAIYFPMVGKNGLKVSNHWKNCSRARWARSSPAPTVSSHWKKRTENFPMFGNPRRQRLPSTRVALWRDRMQVKKFQPLENQEPEVQRIGRGLANVSRHSEAAEPVIECVLWFARFCFLKITAPPKASNHTVLGSGTTENVPPCISTPWNISSVSLNQKVPSGSKFPRMLHSKLVLPSGMSASS